MVSLNDLAAYLNYIYELKSLKEVNSGRTRKSKYFSCFEIDMDRAWRVWAYLSQLYLLFFLFIH